MNMHEKGTKDLTGSEVAIIGMSCRFPGATNIDEFWRNLTAGKESIVTISEDELDSPLDEQQAGTYVKAGSFLNEIDRFDAALFGVTPAEARIMDPQHRILLECAWEAFEHAGYNATEYPGKVGVFVGARTNTYLLHLAAHADLLRSVGAFQVGLANDLGFVSTRISHKFNLRGPSVSVQTACSTALVAIHLACQSLLIDECQLALAGGIAVNVPHKCGYYFEQGGIFSPDGHCRVFDEEARGTVFGSGAGLVLLKRLQDALDDRDCVHAIIRGSAVNNDGSFKASFTAPSVQGQASVISEALSISGLTAEDVSYIEAHGTGTQIGDPIEVRALTRAFRQTTDKVGFCGIGSVKSNLGHLDAAAGIASLIKTVLALKHRKIPPTLHFKRPNPQMDLSNSPFYVVSSLNDWDAHYPRRAGVSSFGVGGTNAHVVLEEAPLRVAQQGIQKSHQLLVLSANTQASLDATASRIAAHLENAPNLSLANVAYTLQVGRRPLPFRKAVVASRALEAAALLAGKGETARYTDIHDPEVAFLFPGEGDDVLELTQQLRSSEPQFRQILDVCAEGLRLHLPIEMREGLFRPRSSEGLSELACSVWAQGELFAFEYACACLWLSWGIRPKLLAGYGLGEYVAACLAGVFSLQDALRLLVARDRCMQASDRTAMLVVDLPESEARRLCAGNVVITAVNNTYSCALSGPVDEIEDLESSLMGKIEMRRLRTSHAFQSVMTDSTQRSFREVAKAIQLRSPQVAIVSSLTGDWLRAEQATDPDYWVAQLCNAVGFSDCATKLLEEPGRILLELGPGTALTQLIQQHPKCTPERVLLTASPELGQPHLVAGTLLSALGELWSAGCSVGWEAVHEPFKPERIVLPTYPFERQRCWVGDTKRRALPSDRHVGSKEPDVSRWFYVSSWRRMPQLPARTSGTPLVTRFLFGNSQDLLTRTLQAEIKRVGDAVITVSIGSKFCKRDDTSYEINPECSGDYEELLENVARSTSLPKSAIYLWAVNRNTEPSTAESFRRQESSSFHNLVCLARAFLRSEYAGSLDLCIVSNGAHEIEGGDRIRPESVPLLAVCKVLPQETDRINCRNIDITLPVDDAAFVGTARHIIAEVRMDKGERIVAVRGERRWAPAYERLELASEQGAGRTIRENGVYLITGGLGAIGLLIAQRLARWRSKLVLVSRTQLPPPNDWSTWTETHDSDDRVSKCINRLKEIENAGAELLPIAADVADETSMRAVIKATLARFGRIDGVIHAAGITHGDSVFRPIEKLEREHAEAQFRPKVYGTYVLERVLESLPIDFIALFSSNAATLGGLGLAAYAAGNLFMDAFSMSRSKNSSQWWISINWDQWPEETRHYKNYRTSVDVYAMTLDESLDAFERLVTRASAGQTIVSTGDLSERYRRWVGPREALRTTSCAESLHNCALVDGAPLNEIERIISEIWQSILGVSTVGVHDVFFDLGGDSLMATRIIARIRESFAVDLPIGDFFETPTISELAAGVERLRAEIRPNGGA